MLYYADLLPQFATKLLRIDAPGGDFEAWKTGRCERWSVRDGWTPYPSGTMEIMATGDWDGIDPDEVVLVMANMIAQEALYAVE